MPISRLDALANRVFVSARSGNNANSCDNITTPCQTFAGAVLQVAAGGEVIVLDSGGYGPVTIVKSLTIEAPPGVLAFIHPPSGDAITINAGATDAVVLRGLVLNGGPADGIVVNTVGVLHIENCVVSGFASIGIWYGAPASKLFVKDTISRQNDDGILMFSGQVSIDHCRFEGNKLIGVNVDGANVTVRDSVSANNLFDGFTVGSAGVETSVLEIYDCVSTGNGRDGFDTTTNGLGSVTARVASSSITGNVRFGLNQVAGVTFESLGDSLVRGNSGGDLNGTITVVPGQ